MSTRMVHEKIPARQAIRRARSKAKDAVTPSTIGIRTIEPSTVGIAAKARFKRIVGTLGAATLALDSIIKIKDDPNASPEAKVAADAALANVNAILPKLAAAADSLIRTQGTAENPEGSTEHSNTAHTNRPSDPAMDAGRQLMDAAIKRAEATGAINPQRVAMGLPDTPAESFEAVLTGTNVQDDSGAGRQSSRDKARAYRMRVYKNFK